MIDPPETAIQSVDDVVSAEGFAIVGGAAVRSVLASADHDDRSLTRWSAYWDDLPFDAHLRDTGRYRRRRHGCFVVDGAHVTLTPPRAHWQPLDYNALHGGIERWFDPLASSFVTEPSFARLLVWLGARASALRGVRPWFVEVHAFRIETKEGIGRPTPEGAHRDGVDFVSVTLIARRGVRGGETRVFDAAGPRGSRFMLQEPWTTLLIDDARAIHETTPIQPLGSPPDGHRDTLVVTLRAGGFQAPPPV